MDRDGSGGLVSTWDFSLKGKGRKVRRTDRVEVMCEEWKRRQATLGREVVNGTGGRGLEMLRWCDGAIEATRTRESERVRGGDRRRKPRLHERS
jgi:hypothetical protein